MSRRCPELGRFAGTDYPMNRSAFMRWKKGEKRGTKGRLLLRHPLTAGNTVPQYIESWRLRQLRASTPKDAEWRAGVARCGTPYVQVKWQNALRRGCVTLTAGTL